MSKRKLNDLKETKLQTKISRKGLKLKDFPKRLEQFDEERNQISQLEAGEWAAGTKKRYWWKCKIKNCARQCEHRWRIRVNDQTRRKVDCCFCARDIRAICVCNSIATKCPELMKLWDYDKNKGIDPRTLGPFSYVRVSFVCHNSTCKNKCIHRWESLVSVQSRFPGCRYCSRQKICPCESFYETNEKLRSEWHPTKNNSLNPYALSSGSDVKAWWLCPKTLCEKKCPHEWHPSLKLSIWLLHDPERLNFALEWKNRNVLGLKRHPVGDSSACNF